MAAITIKQIAAKLGYSTSTVSRALRDSHEISIATKEEVLAYAKSVNYSPNPIALSLKEKKSHAIGIIVPQIANNYFSEVINGIDDVAFQNGYHVIIFQSHESYERELSNLNHLLSRKVDGLIMSLSGTTKDYDHLFKAMEEDLPIIFFDRVPPSENCHKVVSDNFGGAYAATQQLIRQGKKRIAHITSPQSLSITQERLAGYKSALKDNKIEMDDKLIRYCGFDKKEAQDTIDYLIQNDNPDSFFICSDRLALNCYEAIVGHPLIDKNDVSITGYTNLSVANLLKPQLNTVRQPAFETGRVAAELLMSVLKSSEKSLDFQKMVLSNELIIN